MNPIAGTVAAPPSKSETHRAFVLAALSDVPCTVTGPLLAGDTRSTLACLGGLGASWHQDANAIRFEPAPWRAPHRALDAGNSGTTLRLLAAQAARHPWPTTFDGDASLRHRATPSLRHALQALGARMSVDIPPFTVQGPLRSGTVLLQPAPSSQPISGLLLALAQTPGDSRLVLAGTNPSAPYITLTAHVARKFGLHWQQDTGPGGTTWRIPGAQQPRASGAAVAGDWSQAAFWFVAAAITGGSVRVTGLEPRSPQGDRGILELVRSFGAKVNHHDDGATVTGAGPSSPGIVDVGPTPDLFPVLAVLAAAARGTTQFTGIEGLRGKESDRVAAMVTGLANMGIEARVGPDSVRITGGTLEGATVSSHGDHRIHMAFTIAALAARGMTRVDQPECVAVSYPDFHATLQRLREADGTSSLVAQGGPR